MMARMRGSVWVPIVGDGDDAGADADVGLPLDKFDDFDAPPPLDKDAVGVVGQAHEMVDGDFGADGVDFVDVGVKEFGVFLGGDDDVFAVGDGGLRMAARERIPPDHEGHDHLGVEDDRSRRGRKGQSM
jgi:hypothetical protein